MSIRCLLVIAVHLLLLTGAYGATPTVTSTSPTSGDMAGGYSVTITGTNFTPTTTVMVGGVAAPTTYVSSTSLTITAPGGTDGPAYVVASSPGNGSSYAYGTTFNYTTSVPLTISSTISPTSGPATGNTLVTITCTSGQFYNGATVTCGGSSAEVVSTSPTQIDFYTPYTPTGLSGPVNFVVTNPDGVNNGTCPAFTYLPAISSVYAAMGPTTGGTAITIYGDGFNTGATVTINNISTAVTGTSGTDYIYVTTPPADASGPVNVVVTVPSLPASPAATFTYSNTYTWNGSSTVWNSTTSWTPNGVPGAYDSATIPSSNALLPNWAAAGAISVGTLTVLGNLDLSNATLAVTSLDVSGSLTVSGGSVTGTQATVTGSVNVTGGTCSFDSFIINDEAITTLYGGTLSIGSTLSVEDGGRLYVGNDTLPGGILFTNQGSLAIDGYGIITFGSNPLNNISLGPNAVGSTLTIDNTEIHGVNGTINVSGAYIGEGTTPSTLDIEGATITSDSDAQGGLITLNVNDWIENGQVSSTTGNALVIDAAGTGTFNSSGDYYTNDYTNPSLSTDGGSLTITGGSWTYNGPGLVSVSNGLLNLGGIWLGQPYLQTAYDDQAHTNFDENYPSYISATNNSTVILGGSFRADDAYQLSSQSNDSNFDIVGTLDNSISDNSVTQGYFDIWSASGSSFYLLGGTILGGTIVDDSVDGAGTFYGTDSGGTLNSVTLDQTVIFDLGIILNGGEAATCTITGGLLVNSDWLYIGDPDSDTAGQLTWIDSQVWDSPNGNGTIQFSANANNSISISNDTPNASLTIGPGLSLQVIQGTINTAGNNGTLINEGYISTMYGEDPAASLTINAANWSNIGQIVAMAGTTININTSDLGINETGVNLDGVTTNGLIQGDGGSITINAFNTPWINTVPNGVEALAAGGVFGSLTLGNWDDVSPGAQGITLATGTTLTVDGTMTATQLMDIIANPNNGAIANVYILGLVTDTDFSTPVDISTGPAWFLLSGGELSGVEIASEILGRTLTVIGGSAVTLDSTIIDAYATVAVAGLATCNITNSLELTDALTLNGSLTIGTPSQSATVTWNGTQTWGGSGTISFSTYAGSPGNLISDISSTSLNTLTLGDGEDELTITGGTGSISTNANDSLAISGATEVSAPAGAYITITGGTWTNAGEITASDGGTLAFGGSWTSNDAGGYIDISTGAELDLGGAFVNDEIGGNLTAIPAPTCSIFITGTLTANSESPLIDLSLAGNNGNPSPNWTLAGGTIIGGLISDNGSGSYPIFALSNSASNALNGVTIGASAADPANTVVLDLTGAGAQCTVSGGLIVNTWALVGGSSGQAAHLTWQGSQTWNGLGAIAFGNSPSDAIADGNASPNTAVLTFGPQLTVCAGDGVINATSTGASLVNQGTILLEYNPEGNEPSSNQLVNSTGTLTINLGTINTFTNSGTVVIPPGANVQVDGNYVQSLTIGANPGGTLSVSSGTSAFTTPPSLPASSFNALNATGTASIGGIIDFTWIGSTPPTQSSYVVVSAAGGVTIAQTPAVSGLSAPDYTLDSSDYPGILALVVNQPAATVTKTYPSVTATNQQSQLSFQVGFSTAVTPALTPAMLTVGNGTVSPGQISLNASPANSYTVLVTPAGGTPVNEVVSLAVDAQAVSDGAGLYNLASSATSIIYNTTPLTATITTAGSATRSPAIPFTITYSAPVSLPTVGGVNGISASNSSAVAIAAVSSTVYTVTVTASGTGNPAVPVTLTLPTTATADAAGNQIASALTSTVTYDTVAPTVTITAGTNGKTNATPVVFTLTFSEAVSLNASLLTATGGTTIAASTGPATVYTVDVLPDTASLPDTVTLTVPAAAVQDALGNQLAAQAQATVVFDNAPLIATITPPGASTSTSPIPFTVSFSSALVSDPVPSSFTAFNGTISGIAVVTPHLSYTVTLTPGAAGGVFLELPAGMVADAYGNLNQAAIASTSFGTTAPSVVITPASGQVSVLPVVFTLTFSSPVGLPNASLLSTSSNDVLGTITEVGTSGLVYSVPVSTIGNAFGAVTLQVLPGAAFDTNSQPNTASNIASVEYAAVSASTPVTVTVTPPGTTANSSPLVFTLSFSVPLSATPPLTISDLVVTNGVATSITDSGDHVHYTVDVTPNGDGPVTLSVLPGIAQDSVGTANLASPPATVIYHATIPTPSLSFNAAVPVTVPTFTLSVTFNEPVTGFTASGLVFSGAPVTTVFNALSATAYQIQVTPTTPVIASVVASIPAGTCQDSFGNANPAATITIPMQSSNVSTSIATPVILQSPANATIFNSLCPGTLNGLGQLQAFLSSAGVSQARGFVWDASTQAFVTVPAQQPTGGWLPYQGVFLAARVPTNFNFNGYMTTFDFTLTLQPGWNFVGIPPLDNGAGGLTSHDWNTDLQLEDTTGAIIVDRAGVIDVGAWAWNASSSTYSQTTTLLSGIGYWINNASSPAVKVVLRRLSPTEEYSLGAARSSGTKATTTIGYHAQSSTPPAPPSGSSDQSSSSHGCGLGSGIGALVSGLTMVLLMRLRLRSRR